MSASNQISSVQTMIANSHYRCTWTDHGLTRGHEKIKLRRTDDIDRSSVGKDAEVGTVVVENPSTSNEWRSKSNESP